MPRKRASTLSEDKIIAIQIVLTANKDVHELLEAKGIAAYDIIALCDMAIRSLTKSKN